MPGNGTRPGASARGVPKPGENEEQGGEMTSTPLRRVCIGLSGLCIVTAGAYAEDEPATSGGLDANPEAAEHVDARSQQAEPEGMDADAEARVDALWHAAAEGNLERFGRLLAEGVDIDARQPETFTTALWIAAQEGHTELVQILLQLGSDVEAKDPADGRTALFQAAQGGHAEIVELLLAHGAEVEVTSARTGATPLFIASARGHADVVRLLLAANAKVDVAARAEGRVDTPLGIAKERQHVAVIALLEAAMATSFDAH